MEAKVLIELKSKGINQAFTYNVDDSIDSLCIGKRVIVPFSNRKLEGFILEIGDFKEEYELKNIISVVDDNPVLTEELIYLGKYMSKKTLSNLINCFQTMLPKALKASYKTKINKKYDIYFELVDRKYIPKNEQQKKILDKLKLGMVKKSDISIISTAYKTLLQKKIIKEIKKEVYRLDDNILINDELKILTPDQQQVVNKVLENKDHFMPFLLHGVTGSGKTEVYMRIIEEVIKNKEVIVLVPEISLTPQMVNLFKRRFGSTVAIYHSRLSDGERYDEYRKIQDGKVKIVIGARSAIFSPFKNLGLIIVDEEHTDTYKQENNPKYDAIDIALKRAKYNNIPLILGSATPTIESYTRARLGIYKLLELKNRINNKLPIVELVDMKKEIRKGNRIISNSLKEAIIECLNKGEQVILLLNRRGYSTTVVCNDCGFIQKCPNCDIPLIYHKSHNKMTCHYCAYSTYKILKCPECNSTKISQFGLGTEKLQEEVEKIFQVKTLRMDVDTTSKKGSHEKILNAFINKEAPILIGTQMIAKGLDFDNVTLVGVINGDATLNIPDFRSAERTFDLLNQVAGRSGRAKMDGRVIIQGFNLEHYSIKYASKHDYLSFYEEEMKIRKKLNYPPFIDLTLIKISGNNYDNCFKEALKIKKYLEKNNVIILGPSNSNIAKINNKFFIQLILKYKHLKAIYKYLVDLKDMYANNKEVNIDININPKSL